MAVSKSIAVFICAVTAVSMIEAQVILPGSCPDMNVKTDLVPAQFLGTWYEQQKYFFIFEAGGKCVQAVYSDAGNGVIGVNNSQINILTNRVTSIAGTAEVTEPGKLSVNLEGTPLNIPAPYWIVDTDYDNFAVVWSCTNIPLTHTVFTWILTRERQPSEAVLQAALDVCDRNNIDTSLLRTTNQRNCPDIL